MAHGYVRKSRRKANERITSAWNTAYLTRARKLPDLKSLLIDEEPVVRIEHEQTDDEMLAMIRLLNAAWGGIEVEV